jgi:ubiquinol-cytochrome c reductase cytochrome b subunit
MAAPQFKIPWSGWIDYRLPIFTQLNHEYNEYPMPKNCNYMWSFRRYRHGRLITMIVSGIHLAMNYTALPRWPFESV